MKRRILATVVSALLLSACNATSNTSFRDRNFTADRDSAILIDAKQRAILTRVWQDAGKNPAKIRRFCSEPSPDFVSVMAQSLSAGGSFGKSADPTSLQAALNLAYSRSENGSTIARTQTINMLRELMFRTCERFLSGGYDEMELSIQAVRDQRLMVSILAIEQLTGAVSPSPVVINAAGSSGAGLGGEAIKTYATLRDEKKKADSASTAAVKARDEKFGTGDDGKPRECQVIKDELAKVPPGTVDAKKKADCDKLEKAVTDTKAAADDAGKALTTVEQAMTTGGVSASTVSEAIASGGLNRATSEATKDVAGTVERIVNLNFNDQTETMLFCLKALGGKIGSRDLLDNLPKFSTRDGSSADLEQQLVQRCLLYLNAKVEAEAGKVADINQFLTDLKASERAGQDEIERNFKSFWTFVQDTSDPELVDRGKLDSALDRIRKPNGLPVVLLPAQVIFLKCFQGKYSKKELMTCFKGDNLALQRKVIQQ